MGVIPATLIAAPSADKKTWTVTFAGGGTVETGADGLSSIMDGVYCLNIDAAKVHPVGTPGVQMAANSTTVFHRLAGDVDAAAQAGADFAAIVSSNDNLSFRNSFNNPSNYNAYFDLNGDGTINSRDNLQFRTRFNKSLTWTV